MRQGGSSQRSAGRDGGGHRRRAGHGERAGARSAVGTRRAAHAGRTARPRALRAISAGLDLQAGDRHRGAAHRSPADASHLPVPDAGRRPRGNTIAGWNRAIKDDIGDHAHGTLDMERAIAVSCNAYFAQLGVHDVGSKALAETADRLGISTGDPAELRKALPFAAYGQGPVLIIALQDGARGRHHRGRRADAARPLDRRRRQFAPECAARSCCRRRRPHFWPAPCGVW